MRKKRRRESQIRRREQGQTKERRKDWETDREVGASKKASERGIDGYRG